MIFHSTVRQRPEHFAYAAARALKRFVYRSLEPVAITTPRGLPARGPRLAPGSVFVDPRCRILAYATLAVVLLAKARCSTAQNQNRERLATGCAGQCEQLVAKTQRPFASVYIAACSRSRNMTDRVAKTLATWVDEYGTGSDSDRARGSMRTTCRQNSSSIASVYIAACSRSLSLPVPYSSTHVASVLRSLGPVAIRSRFRIRRPRMPVFLRGLHHDTNKEPGAVWRPGACSFYKRSFS